MEDCLELSEWGGRKTTTPLLLFGGSLSALGKGQPRAL